MLSIIATAALAMAVTLIVVLRTRRAETAQLGEQHGAILTVGVQIVCGDCAGDGESPLRTYLDRYGTCASCGGESYVLASTLAFNSAQLIASRKIQAHRAASGGRVLPFGVPVRGARVERIAV